MGRNRTLIELLDDFRHEAGISTNPAHAQGERDRHVRLLQRTQQLLWVAHDWPHLLAQKDIQVEAGQRYVALPHPFSDTKLQRLQYRYNGDWFDLTHGIGPAEYATHDSLLDEREEPSLRYELRYLDDQTRPVIELWPIPLIGHTAEKDGLLRIWGQRALRPLVSDGDRCDIDGDLIAMHAAFDELASKQDPRHKVVSERIRLLEAQLFAGQSQKKTFSLGAPAKTVYTPKHPILGPSVYRNLK